MKRLLLLVALLTAPLALAQQPRFADDEFRDVAGELRCPTCTGLSVLDSDAQFSVQIKDEVKKQLAQGKSKQEILDFFTERYGPWILREPPKSGVNLVAWWLPIALLILGPLGVWFYVWRRPVAVPTYGVRSTAEILREMETELARLKGGRT